MSGIVEHEKACKRFGVKPIFGMEALTGDGHHLTLLAKNQVGLKNLFSLCNKEKSYEDLDRYSHGVIALSGDLMGAIPTSILKKDRVGVNSKIKTLYDIYGKDFFLEKIDHGLREQKLVNNTLDRIPIPSVVTNDVHYANKEDAVTQSVLIASCMKRRLSPNWMGYHIIREAYLKDMPHDPVAESIADMCNVKLVRGQNFMPRFPVIDEEVYLREVSFSGLKERGLFKKEYIERLEYELSVINKMGFPGYFLIVWDFIDYAHRNKIPVGPGRGSGAGSLVAYCLKITNMDPIKYSLLFERFLNPERVSLPDFDIDFGQELRGQVIEYVANKYGADSVCQIGTFSELKARSAWHAASRVMGVSTKDAMVMAKSLPDPQHDKESLNDIFFEGKIKKGVQDKYRHIKGHREVFDMACKIEGSYKSVGKHAAGILIANGNVSDVIPSWDTSLDSFPVESDEHATKFVSQLQHTDAEEMGLVKFDFLGLKELDVIKYALELIENQGVTPPDMDSIPLDDKKTFNLLAEGKTLGIFQVSSQGMATLVSRMEASEFEDIIAAVALYRPGPKDAGMDEVYIRRKTGVEPVEYLHDDLEPILKRTYGIIVYQEQVMEIAQTICGYTLGGADLLRRAMGKKKPEEMARQKDMFFKGGSKYSQEFLEELWRQIETFARYGFNRCLSGDTEVIRSSGNQYQPKEVTILDIYNAQCDMKSSWGKKIRGRGIDILQMDDDFRVRPGRLKRVVLNGSMDVFLIKTENGHEIKATHNHKFLTSNGYKNVSNISVGDLIVVMSEDKKVYSDRRSKFKGSSYGPREGFPCGKDNPSYKDRRTNAFKVAKKEVYLRADHKCEFCGSKEDDGSRFEYAHILPLEAHNGDFLKYHNKENIKRLCNSCHKQLDYNKGERKVRWSKGRPTSESKIISIKKLGKEDVFDIEMDTVGHNFIANGVVSHNSHAAAYAMITYQTAYLKANHPAELLAAQMQVRRDKFQEVAEFVRDAKSMGISIVEPSVNTSPKNFSVRNGEIYVGLTGVMNIHNKSAYEIESQAPFSSLTDFFSRTKIDKGSLDGLVYSGAFDCLLPDGIHQSRADLIKQHRKYLSEVSKYESGQTGLFGIMEIPLERGSTEPLGDKEILDKEREYIGRYLSGHPSLLYKDKTKRFQFDKLDNIEEYDVSQVCVVVSDVREITTKKNETMAFLTVEDETEVSSVTVFPDSYDKSVFDLGEVYFMKLETGLYKDALSHQFLEAENAYH